MMIVYFIIVILTPFWWFIPLLFCGKSHKIILGNYFDFMLEYEGGLFLHNTLKTYTK